MKTYGVNWFLVWVGLPALFCPIYLWAENVLLLPWPHLVARLQPPLLIQALGQSICWSVIIYYLHGKTLSAPKAIEQARQSLQRSKAARQRRYRWLITWTVVFAVVATISVICRLIFAQPSWLHMLAYSLLVPCGCLVFVWLIDKATEKGQLAQRLKESEEETP